jgi:hypothetical protein
MARRDKTVAKNQLTVRCTEEDLRDLAKAQDILGGQAGLSKSDTVKVAIRLLIGKIPSLKAHIETLQKQRKLRKSL